MYFDAQSVSDFFSGPFKLNFVHFWYVLIIISFSIFLLSGTTDALSLSYTL